jgi:hypothetical protein
VSSDELEMAERLEERADVAELLDELVILSPRLRSEMLKSPGRALAVLRSARLTPGIHNRAAFAIARWRAGADPRPPRARAPRAEELAEDYAEPPTLSALEQVWSRDPSPVGDLLLRIMAIAIARAGGFGQLQRAFLERHSPE